MRYYGFAALCLAGFCAAALAAPDAQTRWLTGRALDEQLSSGVSVTWSNAPLTQALGSLSASQHVPIVLDRRVDPGQTIQLTLSEQTLKDSLHRIAESQKLGYCQLGPVAYLGPQEVARRLRTLSALRQEEAKALGGTAGRKFLRQHAWKWNDLDEPRQLVDELAEEAGVKVVGVERIPHDLWRGADLPPLSWIDRMTLLTAEFSLAFHIDSDSQVTLIPWPATVQLSRTYPGGGDPRGAGRAF